MADEFKTGCKEFQMQVPHTDWLNKYLRPYEL